MIEIRKILYFGFGATAIYCIIIFISGYKNILSLLFEFNLIIFILLIFLTLLTNFIRFIRWGILLEKTEIKIPLMANLLIYFGSFSLVLTPAKSGSEIMKLYLIKNRFSHPIGKSSAVIVADRVFDAFGLLFLSLLGILILTKSFSVFYDYLALLIAFSLLLFLLLVCLKSKKLYEILIIKILINRFFKKEFLLSASEEFKKSLEELYKLKMIIFMSIFSAFAWSFEAISLYILIIYFNEKINFFMLLFIFSFSMLVGNFVALPGGIGAVESSLIMMLTQLANIPISVATVTTILFRVASLWVINVIGMICYMTYLKKYEV